jgi:hypothetical protein
LKDVVDEETRQLLVKEERKYNAEIAAVAEIKESVSEAMVNGASQEEMSFMTDPNVPDDVKLRVAKAVTARGAGEMRDLEKQKANASIASSYASAASSRASAAKAAFELDKLKNPDPVNQDQEIFDYIGNLPTGKIDAIGGARSTISQIDRMIELVNTVDDVALLNTATEEGREFQRIRENVVDKLARERTGAVVGADEQKSFNKIAGTNFFNMIKSSDEEIVGALTDMKAIHSESLALNDPSGKAQLYLDSLLLDDETIEEINVEWGVPSASATINPSNYY